jgi:GTP-binding protein
VGIPKAVIVGRPNVGKSSLFNWLVGQRIAIVDPTAGVTRDRVSFIFNLDDRQVELVDTGGMGIEDHDGLTADVERQIKLAMDDADAVIFVLDAQTGVLPLDRLVDERVRRLGKPVLQVANKCDHDKLRVQAQAECSVLGRQPVFTSAAHNLGREEFWNALLPLLPKSDAPPAEVAMKLAVVGKRNAGKSTFINTLAGAERVIVSEIPGTTRDSVDVRFERQGKTFIAIDTAGVRRQSSLANAIEFYSHSRALRTVRRADVVLLFIDAMTPASAVDQKLAKAIAEFHKPCILVVNKWDLAKDRHTDDYAKHLDDVLGGLRYAPKAFITAQTGKNVQAVLDLAWTLFKQSRTRASTADVNKALGEALALRSPPMRGSRTIRLTYATQADVQPPTIVVFCNAPELVDPSYKRFLLSMFRDKLPFGEVPIQVLYRRRGEGLPNPGRQEKDDEPAAAPDDLPEE